MLMCQNFNATSALTQQKTAASISKLVFIYIYIYQFCHFLLIFLTFLGNQTDFHIFFQFCILLSCNFFGCQIFSPLNLDPLGHHIPNHHHHLNNLAPPLIQIHHHLHNPAPPPDPKIKFQLQLIHILKHQTTQPLTPSQIKGETESIVQEKQRKGESKETTSMVARGGERRGRTVTSCGGFVAVNGAVVDE